jgi:hypothetical protein
MVMVVVVVVVVACVASVRWHHCTLRLHQSQQHASTH